MILLQNYSSIYIFASVLVFVLLVIIAFFKWCFNYWNRLSVPQLTPIIPFGDMKDVLILNRTLGDFFKVRYNFIKEKGYKFVGLYFSFKPVLVVRDLELTKTMLVKDFSHFVNHGVFFDTEKDPLSGHLFNLEDNEWKMMRQKLTPTFTSGKIKVMFDTINDCAVGLKTLMNESVVNQQAVDIKEMMGCFSLDVIGSVAFGIECNSLKDPSCKFRMMGKKIFSRSPWESFKEYLIYTLPPFILKSTKLRIIKDEVEDFFLKIVVDMVRMRETKNISRKDFLQLLVQLKNRKMLEDENLNGNKKEYLTMNELAAQAFIFFAAGFDTISTTLSFAFLELSSNPTVQDKLRDEIKSVLKKYDGKLCYEAINEMNYMENILNETLRKYPPLPLLNRKCTKDYNIPNTSITIREGTDVIFTIEGMQYDPEYYEHPEKFEPERFENENKNVLPWFPFGDGPRTCIGMRFAIVEMKIVLCTIIGNYKIEINPKTNLPVKYIPSFFFKAFRAPVWVNVEKA